MERLHDKPGQSSPRLSSRDSELPSVMAQPERQSDRSFSTSTLQDPRVRNAETEGTRTLLNGYASHVSDGEDSSSEDEEENDGDDHSDDNDNHECNDDSKGEFDDDDDDDDDDADNRVDNSNGNGDDTNHDCNDDDGCENSKDDDDDDDDDDNDDDDDDDDDDDNDNDDDDNDNIDCHDDYRSEDASSSPADEDVSVESDKVVESVTEESSVSLRLGTSNSNQNEISNTQSMAGRPVRNSSNSSSNRSSSSSNSSNSSNSSSSNNSSSSSSSNNSSSSSSNNSGNSNNSSNSNSSSSSNNSGNSSSSSTTFLENTHNKTDLRNAKHKEDIDSSENGDNGELLAARGANYSANKTNPPTASAATPIASNATMDHGARPKISSQKSAFSNTDGNPSYYNGKIPSLEVSGINQGFLARHTTDQSLPYSSYSDDHDLRASGPQTSITSNNSSTTLWSLPIPPAPERSELMEERVISRGVNSWYREPVHVGYQPGVPITRSGWQLSNQHQHPQSGRTSLYFPSEDQRVFNPADSRMTRHDESPTYHLSISGHFPGATGTQGANSFSRQAWMPSDYPTSWRWPPYDVNRYQTNPSSFGDLDARNEPAFNSAAVNPSAPSVTLPKSRVNFPPSQSTSSTMSGSVASNSSPLNAFSSNGQERVVDSTRYRPFGSDNQENRRLISSEMVPSRREEERLRNHDSFNLPQERSQTSAPSEDYSLVALERKVAEACAVVEKVLKEREERTKRQREEAQRQREAREMREREARERREREDREMREREEREMRERQAREMREREERGMRDRADREIREQREREERETRERESMTAAERVPVQESPLWQCKHYQRRCSVRFPCCDVFYPCHRCHNGLGACDADDRKANQATHVKCANCGHEEEINEGSQTCSGCGARMSEYFCFICKHFTGVDKNPFHCNKCGICRIYRDRSFHCDVCNVCLDKRLEGKHKCRPDSGHDECCICLEDAFSGCQILPCSHKVHRECAIAMIQNGVRNCPICRHPLYSQGSQ